MYRFTYDDIDDIGKGDMELLADHIENYLDVFQNVMVIPESMISEEDNIKQAVKTIKRLIRKLRKGDRGVFKDIYD